MAANKKSKSGEPSTGERRKAIEADLRAFLASGNKIQQIPTSVSGQDPLGRTKNLVLGRSTKR